jgi:catechol 2,3-dioxygenase-like lactoylglutathione lyase family enzyme
MILGHFTLPTREVERTARFIERTLGYARKETPANSPVDVVWFDLGGGQDMHLLHVDRYEVSAFEGEFGRHVALRHPANDVGA